MRTFFPMCLVEQQVDHFLGWEMYADISTCWKIIYLNCGLMAWINRIALITGLIHWRYPAAGMSMVSSDHFVNGILSFPCPFWKNIKNENMTATLKQKILFLYVKGFPCSKNWNQTHFWKPRITQLCMCDYITEKNLSAFSFPFTARDNCQ